MAHELRAEGPLAVDRAHQDAATPGSTPPSGGSAGNQPPRPPRPRRRRRLFGPVLRFLFVLAVVGTVGGAVVGYGVYRHIAADLPDYRWLADYQPPQMSRIFSADSRLMAELATERRVFVPLAAIPKRVQSAFVAAEDQHFWEHHGVDPLALARAAFTNLEQYGSGRRAVGASTITQQVAKNMLVGADRTLLRKVREAILAVRIEGAMPKERVLEIYLNEIFLGQSAYGVAAAAQNYFGKGLDDLTLAEAAFLGALPKAPNNYNPFRFPDAARARRDWVLDRMVETGAATAQEAAAAKQEPIVPRNIRRPDMVAVGQYFTEEVRRELVGRFGPDQTVMGGLVVRTSLDPQLQAETERILRRHLMNYDRHHGGWHGIVGRISPAATEWLPALADFQRPGGAPPAWKLAVVLDVRPNEARLGWVEKPDPRGAPQPRNGTLQFGDVSGWARPVRNDRLGPLPRSLRDVVSPGDLVFVEPAGTPSPTTGQAAPARLQLRQMPSVEGAVVALDPATGRVMAMAGGWSYDRSQFNRATQAMRQPGSSFKPFVYLAALEQGIPPTQRWLDAPIELPMGNGQVWRPGNYGDRTSGAYVTMRTALQKSLNLVTIRVAEDVGIDRVADVASRFGVIPNMPKVYAMALGAGETTPMRMAAGYAAFANGGHEVAPTLIDSVQDRDGHVVWRSDVRRCDGCGAASVSGADATPPRLRDERKQITDPISAYQITNLLTGVVQFGTGRAAGEGLNRPIAGKTGTTNDYRDNWFVGYTPDIVIAVWVGFDDSRSLGDGETGGGNAAPIFHDVLEAALRGSPAVPFRAPPGVALVRTTTDTGQTVTEAFKPGTENAARPPRGGGGGGGGGGESAPVAVDSGLGGLY